MQEENIGEGRSGGARTDETGWRKADLLTLVFIVVTVCAFFGSTVVAIRDQQSANDTSQKIQRQSVSAANSLAQQVGANTAAVYVTRIVELQTGVLQALHQNRSVQPYAPLTDLDISVGDAVAMLQAGAPQRTIQDLISLFGQLKIAYGKFGPPRQAALTSGARFWGCRALGFGVTAFADLESVRHVLHLSLPTKSSFDVKCPKSDARTPSTP